HAGRDDAARGVDVEGDVLLRVLGFEEEHLGDDEVGDRVVDRLAEEDDVVLQEARVDVVRALSPSRLLDDHGNQDHAPSLVLVFITHNKTPGVSLPPATCPRPAPLRVTPWPPQSSGPGPATGAVRPGERANRPP